MNSQLDFFPIKFTHEPMVEEMQKTLECPFNYFNTNFISCFHLTKATNSNKNTNRDFKHNNFLPNYILYSTTITFIVSEN